MEQTFAEAFAFANSWHWKTMLPSAAKMATDASGLDVDRTAITPIFSQTSSDR